jgi:NitT/TauT family transport system substrate-binding protein
MNLTRRQLNKIKTAIRALALCAAITGCATTTNDSDSQNSTTLTIRGQAPSLTIGVPLTMIANRIDSLHGMKVDLQAFGTSSTISIDAVLAGDAMFGSVGTLTALQAIRQGADLRIVAALVNNVQVMVIRDDVVQKLGVSPTAPIADRVRALKGLFIATGAVGSTHYQILRSYLTQYGLNPDTDVRLIGISEPSAMITGIEQARFDAIAYASPLVEMAIARSVGQVWISGPRGDVPGSENIKTGCIVARTETLEKNRLQVDALRAALTDALRAVQDDPVGTGKRLHDMYFSNLEASIWDTAWNATTTAYPSNLSFPREAYDYWITNDPKGAESYKNVDYTKIIYDQAQLQ